MARKTSFLYAFLMLPAEERRAIGAVWDFCRAVDDAVDEAPAGGKIRPDEAVRSWRAELARCYDGGFPETTEGRELQPVIRRFGLPREAFNDMIDGVAMDLDTPRYSTFPDLLQYCRRVASAVGLICIRVFGCHSDAAREYAINLGIALQLTNIIRDVKDDLGRGRVYLPLEDLERFGCTIVDLKREPPSDAVREVIAFECRRARDFYARAAAALPAEERRLLLAAEIMRAVYVEMLTRVERQQYDVFTRKARVSRPVQAVIALRQWLRLT